MGCRGGEVRVAKATKYSESPIIGYVTVKELVGGGAGMSFTWSSVEKEGGGG